MFNFVTQANFISPNHLSFSPGDSCLNNSIAVTDENYKSFDDGLNVRGIFIGMSKDLIKYESLEIFWNFYVIAFIVVNNK